MFRSYVRQSCVVASAVVAACSPQDTSRANSTYSTIDSAGIEIVQNVAPIEGTPAITMSEALVSIGGAEGPEAELLSRVGGATRLPNGGIALSDNGSASVRLYDRPGNLVWSFGRRGEGPSEFTGVLGPWQVGTDEVRLAAYDGRGQRLTTLTSDGEFLAVRPLRPFSANPPRVAGVLDDLTVVQTERAWTSEPGEFSAVTAHVVVFSPPDWSRDTIYSASTNRRGFVTTESGREVMMGPIFEPHFSADADDSLIVVTDCKTAEYREIGSDGRVTRIVRWPAGDRRVSDEEIALYREEMRQGLSPDLRRAADERLAASPVRDVFPACDLPHPLLGGALRVGTDGDVWVRRYIRPSDAEHTWLRFGDGVLRGVLYLDPSMAVQEFGGDYMIVVERDELDVERVREYVLQIVPANSGG